MSGPGTGRYTTFVPVASSRNKLLRDLFNGKASNQAGAFYGKVDETSNDAAAKAAVDTATAKVVGGVGGLIPSDGKQAADPGMFPTGVDLSFGAAPNLNDVKWTSAGGPAVPYAPDVSSPGPGKTSPLDKADDPKLTVADFKGDTYIPGAPGTGTTSPSKTSTDLGTSPIGKSLVMGKSSV
jgi:hypothetical protein